MAVHLIRIKRAVIYAAVAVLELPQPLLHTLQYAAAVYVTMLQGADLWSDSSMTLQGGLSLASRRGHTLLAAHVGADRLQVQSGAKASQSTTTSEQLPG